MTQEIDWTEASKELSLLHKLFESVHQAGLDSISSGETDVFFDRLHHLGQGLIHTQARLASITPASPPAEVRLQLEQLRHSMDNLLSLNSRFSAQAQRALAVLFPADEVKSYSRLGGRGMGSVGSGNTYLKA